MLVNAPMLTLLIMLMTPTILLLGTVSMAFSQPQPRAQPQPQPRRKTLAQYDQVNAERGVPPTLDVELLLGQLVETNANTMNFLLWDTDGHQYLDMVRFLARTKDVHVSGGGPMDVWVTLIPKSETVPNQAPSRPQPGVCSTCPAAIRNPYGDEVHGVFCCANATIVGGSCGAGVDVCCLYSGSAVGCQGVPRCGNNPRNLKPCGEAAQCSVPADSPLTPFNESALVNHSLGFRGCNDYVGWGTIISLLAAQFPNVRAVNMDDFSVSPDVFTEGYSGAIRDALHGKGTNGGGAVVKFIPTFYYHVGSEVFVLEQFPWLNNVTDGALFYFQNRKVRGMACARAQWLVRRFERVLLARRCCVDGV